MNQTADVFQPLVSADHNGVEVGSRVKQRFIPIFFYDYISLFCDICTEQSIHHLEYYIVMDILIWAEMDCTYTISFWINSQIIKNTFCNTCFDCIDALSVFKYDEIYSCQCETKAVHSQPSIPEGWFINVTPYYHKQNSICSPNIIYHVTLRLQVPPLFDVKYYHMVICLYMTDEKIYHVNKSYIYWNPPQSMCMGNNNEWLLSLKPRYDKLQHNINDLIEMSDVL